MGCVWGCVKWVCEVCGGVCVSEGVIVWVGWFMCVCDKLRFVTRWHVVF